MNNNGIIAPNQEATQEAVARLREHFNSRIAFSGTANTRLVAVEGEKTASYINPRVGTTAEGIELDSEKKVKKNYKKVKPQTFYVKGPQLSKPQKGGKRG